MIYPYKYLSNDIENLHKYIEYFFEEMYKRKTKKFSQIVIHTNFLALVKAQDKLLLTPMKAIYTEFKKLDDPSQKRILDAFKINNAISDLCNGKRDPWKYNQLSKISPSLSNVIKLFFSNLYKEVINKEIFPSKKSHFIKFRSLNKANIMCPFCGLTSLLSEYDGKDNKKDDYDHWLSKGKYPFNSVNFKNLVPMCGQCNQKYKQQKDTLYEKDKGNKWKRRRVFYPYSKSIILNSVTVTINKRVSSLEKDDTWAVNLQGAVVQSEQINSWDKIFDIKSRYKNRIKQRYKTSWHEHVRKLYKDKKKNLGFDFNKFKLDIYKGIKASNLEESAIIEKAYYDYLFTDPDCEKNLKAMG